MIEKHGTSPWPTPERWVAIPEYEGYYEVSDHGRIRSLDRERTSRNRYGEYTCVRQGKVRALSKDRYGYLYCQLTDGKGRTKAIKAHRAVLLAFKGSPPEPDYHCNHKDCRKDNNRLDNLEWVSQSENHKHAVKNGIHTVCLYRDSKGRVRRKNAEAGQ